MPFDPARWLSPFGALSPRGRSVLGLAVVVLVAGTVRGYDLGWELPHLHHPDEPNNFTRVQKVLRTGDYNPHFFRYPSLSIYLVAWLRTVLGWFGVLDGAVAVAAPIEFANGVALAPSPGAVLVARLVSAVLGTGTAVLAFLAASIVTGRAGIATLAGLLAATSPTAIRYSRILAPDVYGAFFAGAAVLAALVVLRSGRTAHYLTAGALVGLAVAGKYNAAGVMIAPVAAHLIRVAGEGVRPRAWWRGLFVLGGAALAAFVLVNPYFVLDWRAAVDQVMKERTHYESGQPGSEGDAALWYLRCLWSVEGGTLCLALFAVYDGVRRRLADVAVLGAYLVAYLALVSTFEVRNARTLMPVLATLDVLAAVGVYRALAEPRGRRVRLAAAAALLGVMGLIRAYPAVEQVRLEREVPADLAAKWIRERIRKGAVVALESGGPILDPKRYDIVASNYLYQRPLREYERRKVALFVVCAGGKYRRLGDRYRDRADFYQTITRPEHKLARFRAEELRGRFARAVALVSEPSLQAFTVGYHIGAGSCTVYRAPWSRSGGQKRSTRPPEEESGPRESRFRTVTSAR